MPDSLPNEPVEEDPFAETPPPDGASSAPILRLLSELGGAALIGPLVEVFGVGNLDAEELHYLNGPVLIGEGGFKETLPDWLPKQAKAERVTVLLEKPNGWIVGAAEIVCAMYAPLMQAPTHHEYAELYVWAGMHACARHYGRTVREQIDMFGDDVPLDDQVVRGNSQIAHAYRRLAHDIRRKVVAASRARSKKPRKKREA